MKKLSVLLALLLVLGICLTGCQPQRMGVEEYLQRYATKLEWENGITNRAFGNADYRVFLSGETHAKQKGYEAKKLLIQYFHEKQKVDYLIFEIGMGHGFLMDDYIRTGNEENLRFFLEELKGTMAYSQEEYEFWQWLYEYNQQQPQKRKLHVLGLDIEFQANSSARGLSLLLDESVTPAQEIRPLIEKLKASDGEALGKLPKAMEQYPQEMQEAFGENFAWAQQYAKNITATVTFYQVRKETEDEEQAHRVRDDAMTEKLCFAIEQLPKQAKFFGQSGNAHVLQKDTAADGYNLDYHRFATQLQEEDSPVKGQVCSIYMAFPHKNVMAPSGYAFPSNKTLPFELFEDYFGQDTLIPLDEKGSPFVHGEGEEATDPAAGLTDYFQKVMLLPGSKDAISYQG